MANSDLHAFPKVVSRITRFGGYLTVRDTLSIRSASDAGNEFPSSKCAMDRLSSCHDQAAWR